MCPTAPMTNTRDDFLLQAGHWKVSCDGPKHLRSVRAQVVGQRGTNPLIQTIYRQAEILEAADARTMLTSPNEL
jgi:hypothetical protein